MFLKEALKMTDKIGEFNKAGSVIQRAAGYKRGMAQVVNLAEAFNRRGITFGNMDGFSGQIEK